MAVLEEGDKDERVVEPEVGHAVDARHLRKAAHGGPVDEDAELELDADVADEDLGALVRGENDGTSVEIVGHRRVMALASRVVEGLVPALVGCRQSIGSIEVGGTGTRKFSILNFQSRTDDPDAEPHPYCTSPSNLLHYSPFPVLIANTGRYNQCQNPSKTSQV